MNYAVRGHQSLLWLRQGARAQSCPLPERRLGQTRSVYLSCFFSQLIAGASMLAVVSLLIDKISWLSCSLGTRQLLGCAARVVPQWEGGSSLDTIVRIEWEQQAMGAGLVMGFL